MKLFILSNTNFGQRGELSLKKWLDHMKNYFYDDIIPYIKKNKKDGDIFIHMGNVFSTKNNLNTSVIYEVQKIFKTLSNEIPIIFLINKNDTNSVDNDINTLIVLNNIKNLKIIKETLNFGNLKFLPYTTDEILNQINYDSEYLFLNSDLEYLNKEILDKVLDKYKMVFNGYNKNYTEYKNYVEIGSPYYLDKDSNRFGMCVFDTVSNNYNIIENLKSPKSTIIEIKTLDDLNENLEKYQKDIVEILIDEHLYKTEKIKVELYLNKYNFNKIKIKDYNKVEEPKTIVTGEYFDIREMILSKIKDDIELVDEFKNVVELYKSKFKENEN